MGEARVGKTLGNFRILECLGSGGSGMIWKAEDVSLGRIVALKALRSELATDREMSQRFRDEARTLARLSHANIASLYSFLEDDDGLYLVLEYVEGNTLAALLATSGPLPLDSAFALFHQMLDGVGHAHEAGIVHRDLKPSNLMVDARGRVKVMDFGIARVAGAARTTHHGKLVGTPEYMSPEQVRGADATLRSDLYSLGIVLFEMLTGQPPFRGTASFELMRAQVEDAPPHPRTLRPELDDPVCAAILRALAKRPAERFASTRELQDALLDAGRTRRGRAASPLWRELPRAALASEAPTLASVDAAAVPLGAVAAPAEPAARGTRPESPATEPLDAWSQAVDALGDEIDAALRPRTAHDESRAHAPSTIVLDVTEDTARLDVDRPTRAIPAPLASHDTSAEASADPAPAANLRSGVLAALAAAALIALALGAVRLSRSADEAAAVDEPRAAAPPEAATAAAEIPPAPKPAAAANAATRPDPTRAAAAAPDRNPPRSERPAPRAAAKRESTPSPPRSAPAAQPEDGWVIRR